MALPLPLPPSLSVALRAPFSTFIHLILCSNHYPGTNCSKVNICCHLITHSYQSTPALMIYCSYLFIPVASAGQKLEDPADPPLVLDMRVGTMEGRSQGPPHSSAWPSAPTSSAVNCSGANGSTNQICTSVPSSNSAHPGLQICPGAVYACMGSTVQDSHAQ